MPPHVNQALLLSELFAKLPYSTRDKLIDMNDQVYTDLYAFQTTFQRLLIRMTNMPTRSTDTDVTTSERPIQNFNRNRRNFSPTLGLVNTSKNNNRRPKSISNSGGSTSSSAQNGHTPLCKFCSKEHFNDQCRTYTTVDARKARLRQLSPKNWYCMSCLSLTHVSQNCPYKDKITCAYCKGPHHRSMCIK